MYLLSTGVDFCVLNNAYILHVFSACSEIFPFLNAHVLRVLCVYSCNFKTFEKCSLLNYDYLVLVYDRRDIFIVSILCKWHTGMIQVCSFI